MRRNIGFSLLTLVSAACGDRSGSGLDTADSEIAWTDGMVSTSEGSEGSTSSSESSSEDGGGAGTDTDGGIVCGEASYQLQAIPPNVMLVLDKSGSMISNTWDHDGDGSTAEITRWASLHAVVESVVGDFDQRVNFGAVLFPSIDARAELSAAACTVGSAPEVPVMARAGSRILDEIPAADAENLEGATPATAGTTRGLEHLLTLDTEIPRAMILVTDGAANCGADLGCTYPGNCPLLEAYDDQLSGVVGSAWTDDAIPTYVVGIDIADVMAGVGDDGAPEANAWLELNAVAAAGGVARTGDESFYNTASEIELAAALEAITDEVVSCEVPLDPPPAHPDYVDVEIGGEEFARVGDCTSEDGWIYAHPTGPFDTIVLCGAACDRLKEVGELDAIYGCPPAG